MPKGNTLLRESDPQKPLLSGGRGKSEITAEA